MDEGNVLTIVKLMTVDRLSSISKDLTVVQDGVSARDLHNTMGIL